MSSRSSEVSLRDPQVDAALGGERRLGHEQRGDRRVADPAVDEQVQGLARSVTASTYRTTSSYSPSWIRPVMVCSWLANSWVCARSSSVVLRNEPISRSRLASVGPVPQRGDRAEAAAVPVHAHPVHHEHPAAPDHDLVPRTSSSPASASARRPAGEDVEQAALDPQVAQARADGMLGQVEQSAGDVVDQGDPVVRVERDHPFGDAVEQRLPVLCQTGDLVRFEAEGLPLDAPGQQPRAEPRRARRAMPR